MQPTVLRAAAKLTVSLRITGVRDDGYHLIDAEMISVDLFDELIRAFNGADVLMVTDVYAAGEAPIEGADAASLVEAIRRHGHRDVSHVADQEDLAEALQSRLRPGDVVITLGAGSITRVGPALLDRLRAADQAVS